MILYIKMSPWLAGDLKQTRLDQTRHCLVGHNVRKKYLYENRSLCKRQSAEKIAFAATFL